MRTDQAFSPASVTKLGTGVLLYHEPGLAPTIRDFVTETIITSDNPGARGRRCPRAVIAAAVAH